MSIVIINYGLGNLGSIQNMFKHLGIDATVSGNRDEIMNAAKLILPGVGSFDSGMDNLDRSGLMEAVRECALIRKIPLLGICLGMQLLTNRSDEGNLPGLGLVNAETLKFSFNDGNKLKIPQMGWNCVSIKKQHYLAAGLENDARFYFAHSYFVKCYDKADMLFSSEYGFEFTCAFQRDNIMGVQFHPEKSHKFGMRLLKNFVYYG